MWLADGRPSVYYDDDRGHAGRGRVYRPSPLTTPTLIAASFSPYCMNSATGAQEKPQTFLFLLIQNLSYNAPIRFD
jgi:hypothetical protein